MPYIDTASRHVLDVGVKALAERVSKTHTNRPGDMNYAISALIRKVYGEKLRYHEYNEIMGFLECAKTEFYRRRVAVYEDKKILENGDLYIDKP